MSLSPDIDKIISLLPDRMRSPHFVVHYGLRNPPAGRGLGADGVRDRVLVLTYLNALERLYRVMTAPPWNRAPPVVGPSGRTEVFICDHEPFMAADENKVPLIILSSRSCEPTTNAELCRATAEAVHEATHVFNFTRRPVNETSSEPWVWFDEGMAVLMEMLVVSGNPDYFRFMVDWVDSPETPLDEPYENYQCGMFLRYLYLCENLGPDFINEVWMNSALGDGPLQALERVAAGRGLAFSSPNPAVPDIFANGYCMDPYFVWDHASVSLSPDMLVRFGERAVSQTFWLKPKTTHGGADYLDHLSCRYYRIYLDAGVTGVQVRVGVDEPCGETKLKAELAVVSTQRRRGRAVALTQSPPPSHTADRCRLSATLTGLKPKQTDHLVLVVSNCGTVTRSKADGDEHDDGRNYRIEITAV